MSQHPVKISTGGVKKARNEGVKAITANRLADGLPVYLTNEGAWSLALVDAARFEGAVALDALAAAGARETEVVGPYLMDIEEAVDTPSPDGRGRLREEIRRDGPTIPSDYSVSVLSAEAR